MLSSPQIIHLDLNLNKEALMFVQLKNSIGMAGKSHMETSAIILVIPFLPVSALPLDGITKGSAKEVKSL
jgi:hypothetical protein